MWGCWTMYLSPQLSYLFAYLFKIINLSVCPLLCVCIFCFLMTYSYFLILFEDPLELLLSSCCYKPDTLNGAAFIPISHTAEEP